MPARRLSFTERTRRNRRRAAFRHHAEIAAYVLLGIPAAIGFGLMGSLALHPTETVRYLHAIADLF